MTDILTVTLNPALDLATTTPSVAAGPKLRCDNPSAEPGGGGVNVARAIGHLGGSARALVAAGGPNGRRLDRLIRDQGVDVALIDAPGETRMSLAVTATDTGAQFRFVMPGPVWSATDLDAAVSQIAQHASPEGIVILSGSLPSGADPALIPQIVGTLSSYATVIVDTSGAALHALAHGVPPAPTVLRMDAAESRDLAGSALTDRADSAAFAASLVAKGAATRVIIARGAEGSVMAGPEGQWFVNATNDRVVSAVGAGDSFVGGFALALSDGAAPAEALRHGAAAASAACLTKGSELCTRDDFERLLPRTEATRL